MKVEDFVAALDADFFTGIPDSLLKALSSYLIKRYGTNAKHHVIAANEGNAAAIAAGYHLATGKFPVVYMQNSGEGNCVNPVANPVASLLHPKVYGIPVIFVVGWRGEPGVHDEPQHLFQGEITVSLLKLLGIETFVVTQETTRKELTLAMTSFEKKLKEGVSVAFVVKKGALTIDEKIAFKNSHKLKREEIIAELLKVTADDPIISTTGKASRELFELRVARGESHEKDFLTVGSMGHSSSIALGIALQKPETKIWIIDGDGAALMHMGAMAVIGAIAAKNLIHVLINNEAHESVGGMPTVGNKTDFTALAKACGYINAVSVCEKDELNAALKRAKEASALSFIEVKAAIGARSDLGRPTTSAKENKIHFMKALLNS